MQKILKKFNNWHIVMVGCGGTGSNLVPHLAQLVYSLKSERVSVILADQDVVEPDNIGRQLFIEPEVGENKAGVLQMRYYTAWGVNLSYYPHYITEEGVLIRLLCPLAEVHGKAPVMPILLGCVDNVFTRRIFEKVFRHSENLIYLDAGNSEFSGQVVMGFRYKGKTLLKPAAEYFPEILTEQDEIQVGGTCTRNMVKQPQSLVANLWAAVTMLSFLNSIMGLKEVPVSRATFNARNTIVRPQYVSDPS